MAPDAIEKFNQKDLFATVVGSIGFALGCTACFGGAIIGTLIVYVGAIGSPVIGGSIMFIFGLGVAIPFFLSALFLSKSKTFMLAISSYRKSLNLISAAVVMLFGLILVTDNFHTVSDFIYPYLGLS
jgi:cytochrome c-type biogenesis protein